MSGRAAALLGAIAVAVGAGGCKPYRIEHHTRPAFFQSASQAPLPDEIEMPDGTLIVYSTQNPLRNGLGAAEATGEAAKTVQIREENPDGSVILRSILPEHVVGNTMTCLRNEEYQLMWEQLLARSTRQAYEAQGLGYEGFAAFMQQNRREIMTTLNRMSFGFYGSDVVLERNGQGGLRARLSPFVSSQFKFTTIEVAPEDGVMKLLLIR
ncbi:MAG: hypothetical protein KDA22_14875 [Phycisphaerales bacterium]|nr:hypothetical protein [Phycisphaerales bacterium]